MDEVDFKIMDILKQDARTPFTKIAQKLGVGTDTVIRRYKKLLNTGIISKPMLVLSSRICGFEGCVDFYIKLQQGKDVDETIAQLAKIRNVTLVGSTLGDIDILCGAFFTDFKDLIKLTQTIKVLDSIYSVGVSVYMGCDWTIPLDYEIGHNHL
jgi:Lrp/AsnC family transcriptional regulator for asnA, asnC and gidA